jgi:hypothetical protein
MPYESVTSGHSDNITDEDIDKSSVKIRSAKYFTAQ